MAKTVPSLGTWRLKGQSLGRRSPLVRKWFREYGIDPSEVRVRENEDRISKRDVEKHITTLVESLCTSFDKVGR